MAKRKDKEECGFVVYHATFTVPVPEEKPKKSLWNRLKAWLISKKHGGDGDA